MMTIKRVFLVLLLTLGPLGCSATTGTADKSKKAMFHYKLANNHFYDEQIVSALKELMACLKYQPDHPDAHHLVGFIFLGRKEYTRAERHLRKALELRPAFHEARGNLGVVLLHGKRWMEAIEVFGPLVDATLYATPWLVHNNLGYAYQKLMKHSLALKHYRQAIFHNPKFCLGYNNLGVIYKELGQENLAIDYLHRAITRCEKYAEPHFHLGTLYEARAQFKESRQEFATCFKIAPESPFGRRCRVRL